MGERVIMNREILFKAKRIDNGEWVEGFIFEFKNKFYITEMAQTFMTAYYTAESVLDFNMRAYEIKPDTLCQYTGLTDKNDKKIWENDLLGHKLNRVEFLNGTYCINGDRSLFFEANTNEVIGNIFDNPELLEAE